MLCFYVTQITLIFHMNQILLKRHFPHKEHTESQADTIRFLWNKIKQYEQRNQKAELKESRSFILRI